VRGIENIRPIYRKAQAVTRVVPDGDIRTSHGNAGAMAFTIHTEIDGTPYEIKAVDVITLDADGKIQSLKAYWGPSDIRPLQ
jgi:steroid delta-isomerase